MEIGSNKFSKKVFQGLTLVSAALVISAATLTTSVAPVTATTYIPAPYTNGSEILVDQGFKQLINISVFGENLSETGLYSASFRISQDTYRQSNEGKDVSFPIHTLLHKCNGGNGNDRELYCWQTNFQKDVRTINLNKANNWTQEVTFTIQQDKPVACGAFQIDLYSPNITTYDEDPNLRAATIYRTGKDVSSCSPAPTSTPTPPAPTPPAPTTPPVQNQDQDQKQKQDNKQDQKVEVKTGDVNVNNTVNVAAPAQPKVIGVSTSNVKELPKTGLPIALWGISALAPLGLKLRKKGTPTDTQEEVSANSIWMDRELNK